METGRGAFYGPIQKTFPAFLSNKLNDWLHAWKHILIFAEMLNFQHDRKFYISVNLESYDIVMDGRGAKDEFFITFGRFHEER